MNHPTYTYTIHRKKAIPQMLVMTIVTQSKKVFARLVEIKSGDLADKHNSTPEQILHRVVQTVLEEHVPDIEWIDSFLISDSIVKHYHLNKEI